MPRVTVAPHLVNQFPVPRQCTAAGETLAEIVADLERQYPGVRRYLLDDQGALRQHVNLFVGDRWTQDRQGLSDPVGAEDEVFVFQALSGG